MGGSAIKKPVKRESRWAIFLVLCVLGVLICASCGDPPFRVRDDPDLPDVRWTEDWKYVTVYLDDAHLTSPYPLSKSANTTNSAVSAAGESRAMTPDTARMGFSFFEAFFYCDGIIKRTAWEIGTRAYVKDVYRDDDAGVDYSGTSVPATGIMGSAGQAAILFAGRKNDKTLLAVGKIYSVDDVPGAIITRTSSYVTFELFALTGGVSYEARYSSFLTAYDTTKPVGINNTYIIEASIGDRRFPLYNLPEGKPAVSAEYTFKLDGAEWEEFAKGVMISRVFDDSIGEIECGSATIRNPRYLAGGIYWYPDYMMDITTTVKMLNNQEADRPAENTVKLEFNTVNSTGIDIGLFTLGFRIPVVPLMPAEEVCFISPSPDEGETVLDSGTFTWFIRPAYQSYYYNIDNAVDSKGGGVLMGFFRKETKTKHFDRTNNR